MKKLLTMIVAATAIAFGAKTAAADPISSVNFDSLNANTDYDAALADNQDSQTAGPYFWVTNNLAQTTVSTIIGQVKAYSEPNPASNVNYLELDTDAVIYRRHTIENGDAVGATMGQIFVDALVQFTPSDEDAECAINTGDKIAIWMREANIDATGENPPPPVTNLLVHAGGTSGATDYVIAGDWKAGQWYRLVIKSSTTAANGNPGFVIFIDGNKVKDVNDVEVFPSLDTTTEDRNTIKAIGFNGTGAIDQIAFTTDDPCPEVKPFTINWDSHVATLSIEYPDGNGGTIVSNLTNVAGGTETVLLPPTGGTVGVTYTLDSTFAFDADASTASNCSYANGVVTVGANAIEPSFSIVTYSQNFFVGGNSFASFEDALEATGGNGKITLGKNVAIPYNSSDENPGQIYVYTGSLIIDLAGHTLAGTCTGEEQEGQLFSYATIVNAGCDLVITNSTVEIGSVVGPDYGGDEYGDSLCTLGGTTTIFGGKFENAVDVENEHAQQFTLVINGGYFKANGSVAGENFNLASYVDPLVYQPADDNGYVVVSEIPAANTYNVTLPAAPANSSWSVTVNGEPVSGSGNVYTAGEGASVTATLSVAEGYLFSDGTTSKVYSFEGIDSDINASTDPGFVLPTVVAPKAKIGTTLYLSLQDAINAVPAAGADYTTITVIGDQTLPSGTKAIVTNKKVDFEAESAVVVTGQLRVVDGADVIIGQNVTFTSTSHPTVFILGDPAVGTAGSNGASSLVINGVVANTNPSFDATFAIAGNGSDTLGADITVNGTVTNANGIAIYQAFPGDLVVNGTVVGASAISIKDGSLTVNDGAVVAATLADGQAYVGNNNGESPTGDAIIAPYYPSANGYGTPVLDIEGGTITVADTANCSGIEAYDFNGVTAPDDSKSNVNVSGGTFNTPIADDYCADGYVPADNGAGSYGVDFGYTITYVSAYGTAPAAKNVTVATLNAAYTLVAADLPEMVVAGQVFNGWGKAVGDTISADTTLTAQWASANYTITLPAAAANTSWYVEADGTEIVPVAGVYTVAAGADVVVYSKADGGYLFENGTDTKTVYTFEDIAASQDKSADAAPAPAAAKAKIGTVLYLSLNDAVSGAADGDVVELLDDVTLDARIEPNVGANTELTIDLGGYTITRTGTSGNGSAFDVKSGSVVITNGAIACTQDDTAIAADGVYAITSRSGSNVTLADLTITVDSECGACAYPFAGSTMTIESGTYANVTTTPYRYNLAITGMAVNQPNNSTQNLIIKGGSFSQYDPQLGDDSGAMTDFTDDGFVAIQDGSGNWVVQTGYNVTFDANGGTPAPDAQRVAAGGTATAPTAPTYEGYTFNGWKLNDAAYDFSTVLSGDITLVADWTAAPVAVVLDLSGSGTAVDPYVITNLTNLQNFRDWVNDGNTGAGKYFKVIAASIDLASESPWTPIGSKEESKYFSGEFDGNGVVINNLSLEASPDYPGFFSAVDGAVLKNFTLGASTITGLGNGAAVCAYTKASGGATFSNIVNNVSVSGSKKIGGFVCQANGENTFIDCVNNGAIACTALTDGKLAGGFIAMYNHGAGVKATFLRCVNNGTIGNGGICAGFVAYDQTTLETGGIAFNCSTNNGSVTSTHVAATGFIGKNGNSGTCNGDFTFVNCAQLGTLTGGTPKNFESAVNGLQGTHGASGKNTVLSAYNLTDKDNNIQAQTGWLWNAKIVGATYTTLYSDLATAVADADGETLVIAADSTLSNSFDIDGTVTIGSGITVSGGNLRINSGTLAITNGTFTGVSLATSGTGAITITGGTFDADPTSTGFIAEGYAAVPVAGGYTVQQSAPPAGKWDAVEAESIAGLTSENKEAVEATLDKLETALGSVSDVADWISLVYGEADVPAAKLAATTDALIAISLAYDLPILEGEPEVAVAVTTTTTGKAAFTFTFTDDGDPVSVQAEKALQLIKYSATVNGEFAYTPAKFVVTAVTSEYGNVLKAEFVGADAAGYGKVDFTVPQN